MKEYKVIFIGKTPVNNAGEIPEFRLTTIEKTIFAESLKKVREKVRRSYHYEIVHIDITEVRPSWIIRMIRKMLRR